MPQIVTMTVNPALDRSSTVSHVIPNKKLRCTTPQWQAGGGGINVARGVRRLGGAPLAIFPAGGCQGEQLTTRLAEEEVMQEVVSITEPTRISFAVRERESDHQYRFSVPGPTLKESEWQDLVNRLKAVDPPPPYLVLSGGLAPGVPDTFYRTIATWAQQVDTRIILDTHDEPLRQAMETGVFLLKPNLRELRQLTGTELDREWQQREALQQLVASGKADYIVLSLGAAGALFAEADTVVKLPAPTVTIRSKVGAGDSMVGGIVWALANGFTPRKAAYLGIAAGAAAVQTAGTQLCRRDNVFDLYEEVSNDISREATT